MKILLLFTAALFLDPLTPAAPTSDPFGNEGAPRWTQAVSAAKPLRLEICIGRTDTPLPTGPDPLGASPQGPPTPQVPIVTPAFLDAATRIQVAVAPNDQGRITLPGKAEATYQLTTKDQSHRLNLQLSLQHDTGKQETNTQISLKPDHWLVVGGTSREEAVVDKSGTRTSKTYLTIAVRLTALCD